MRRWIRLILILLLLGGAYAAHTWRRGADARQHALYSHTVAARRFLEREVRIRAATGQIELNGRGWPTTVDPAWFSDQPPLNPMVPGDHPWVEIASPHEEELSDPAIRQALTRDVAMFWYNPATGAVRARVGPSVTDAAAVDLYNRLNGSSVESLFAGGVTVGAPATRGSRAALSRGSEGAGIVRRQ